MRIADLEGLSGELAHKRKCPVPTSFIGPLSRFDCAGETTVKLKYDIMAIVSGPEPQRSILEKLLYTELKASGKRSLMVLGKPESMEHRTEGNVDIYSHMESPDLRNAILSSGVIICRPGYSSIMDLAVLGTQAIFIPTPGQTEQEYLAEYHQRKHHYYYVNQDDFDLEKSVQASRNYPGIKISSNNDMLDARIDELLSRL